MSMARLRRDQGKQEEARELLAPVYGWFTEGFDTRDLKRGQGATRRSADLTTNFETASKLNCIPSTMGSVAAVLEGRMEQT
jgi:hypothetical protein